MDPNSQPKTIHPRPHTNDNCNGPRVSFNKDVHVKRIGNRPNESPHFGLSSALEQQQLLQPQYKRQLPVDLTEEELIKEAAKVLAQSERIKCTADTPNSFAGIRLQEKLLDDRKFSSLPHRKKKSKPVNRSVSDASQKKLKRGSIFNLFSKRSDPTLNTSSSSGLTAPSDKLSNNSGTVAVAINKRSGKPVGRSKSDVGYQRNPNDSTANVPQPRGRSLTLDRKRNKNGDIDDQSMTKPKKKSQLSPISENPPDERYFGASADERALLRATKSEEKPSRKPVLSPHPNPNSNHNHSSFDVNHKSHDDLELMSDDMQTTVKRNPIARSTSPPPAPPRTHSQSMESLHSSQLPQERLPLTKGVMVDGIVKRLSMERFSPPPSFTSPAFSYTRPPNESIVYAQVLRDENGEKSTRPSHKTIASGNDSSTHFPLTFGGDHGDRVDFAKTDYHRDSSPSHQVIQHHIHLDKNEINNKYRYSPRMDSPEQPHRIVKKDKPRNLSPLAMTSPQRYRMAASPTRNYSDEDEGIGFESSRKRFHDEDMIPSRDTTRQSSAEPPIIPTFRPSYGGSMERINELANRRKLLESKIHERTFGSPRELNGNDTRQYSPQRLAFIAEPSPIPERYNHGENNNDDREEFATEQVPPVKTVSPPRKQWSKQPKYYPETNLDDEFCRDTDSIRREQERLRHKQLIEKEYRNGHTPSNQHNNRVIDLGYIDQYQNAPTSDVNINNRRINYKYPTMTRTSVDRRAATKPRHHSVDDIDTQPNDRYPNPNFSTLEREKQKYRSFDKGDSGIENDIKRERDHNHNDLRQRPYITGDAIKTVTELFLKRERQLSELMHPSKKRYEFVFRERSIDDGSHFDPRLDKYQEQQHGRHTLTRPSPDATKKSDKKFGSLKKMKDLFLSSSKKKLAEKEKTPSPKDQHKPMSETSMHDHQDDRRIDISTRRRLSTPKASPLPKRNLSQKSSKISHVSSYRGSDLSSPPPPQQPPQPKTSWFKSLERLSRKQHKSSDAKPKPSAMVRRSNTTIDRSMSTPQQRNQSPSPIARRPAANLRFFGDTDLESVNASISKAATTNSRSRKPLHANHSQSAHNLTHNGSSTKSTQINNGTGHPGILNKNFRSKYLQDLSESTSENENINGDRSTLTKQHMSPLHQSTPNAKSKQQRRQYHSTEYLDEQKYRRDRDSSVPYGDDVNDNGSHHSSRLNGIVNEKPTTLTRSREKLSQRNALREQNGRASSETRHLPPKGPLKPAREFDRRRALSNERFLESSGTEGDSSQQSVVYLHATTVGHIPQPYVLNSRRSSKSRDEVSSIRTKSSMQRPQTPPPPPAQQPMSRTVSRSVSMLAPWTPRHISDGYEINYSQTMQNNKKKNAADSRKEIVRRARSRDDLSSVRNSSMTSATTTMSKHRK